MLNEIIIIKLELDENIELTIAESIAKHKSIPLKEYLINALSRQIIQDVRSFSNKEYVDDTGLLHFTAGLILDAEERIEKEITNNNNAKQ